MRRGSRLRDACANLQRRTLRGGRISLSPPIDTETSKGAAAQLGAAVVGVLTRYESYESIAVGFSNAGAISCISDRAIHLCAAGFSAGLVMHPLVLSAVNRTSEVCESRRTCGRRS
jgi:hypothetical protein